jgi:phosphoglycerol transferase MdoB-like AlkP superfamily enzyme
VLSFLISTVNYFVIQLHDSPLTIAELGNLRTAMNVIGGYQINLSKITGLLVIFILQLVLIFFIKKEEKQKRSMKVIFIRDVCLAISSFLIFFFSYMTPNKFMSESLGWRWVITYQKYGYMACTIKAACLSNNYPIKPDSYDENYISNIEIEKSSSFVERTPDIILVLNESFYDLSLITEIEVDVPYLENIMSMENAIKGYAVIPGGGTNPSEYELLTSNSMKLLKDITPFNVIDMEGENSIVSYLKKIGYNTTGAHCASPANYNRGRAYRDMGFDKICFDTEFENKKYFENRAYATDESLYENVLSWLKESDEVPQFIYLLTIQNHGGWDSNEEEMNIVHALNDYAEYDKQVDEYLSCIRLSDQAFKDFTDSLQSFDRDIIVCMVGDHGPDLAAKIMDDPNSAQSYILRTCVPFVIWANYDIQDSAKINGKAISLNYLVPTILKIAKVRLSPYYEYMLNLMDQVPVTTTAALYYDKEGNSYMYENKSKYTEMVNNYFNLEYNNLSDGRIQRLFEPYD